MTTIYQDEKYCGPISWIIGCCLFPCIACCPVDTRKVPVIVPGPAYPMAAPVVVGVAADADRQDRLDRQERQERQDRQDRIERQERQERQDRQERMVKVVP
jgi:hypothetical protein